MKLFNSIEEFEGVDKPVLTMGMFDGVHLGHQKIINLLNHRASSIGGESVLLTFEPHPRQVLKGIGKELQLLTPIVEKMKLLKSYGLQNLIIHPFSKEFSMYDSEDFVKKFLIDKIGIDTFIIGHDHHFGKNRQGNFDQLTTLSKSYKFNLEMIEEVKNCDMQISSTQIRNYLFKGDVKSARKGLGRNYRLEGTVVHGDKLGRTLGFPTANLSCEKFKLIPGDGVYLVKVFHKMDYFKGLLSIGTRPTITDSKERRLEVYILDFDKDIYGEILTVELIHKIRDDKKFDSVDELVEQMNADKMFAQNFVFEWNF